MTKRDLSEKLRYSADELMTLSGAVNNRRLSSLSIRFRENGDVFLRATMQVTAYIRCKEEED